MGGVELRDGLQTDDSRRSDAVRRLVADGIAAMQAQRFPVAESALSKALQQMPGDAQILRLLAMALQMQQRSAEALALLRRAAQMQPDDPLIWNGLGTALDLTGEREEAVAAFRRACELAPQTAQLWANLGKTLGDRGWFEQAVPALERATQLSTHKASRLRLAHAQRALGQRDAAVRIYRELIAESPTDSAAWIGLANLRTPVFSAEDIATLSAALRDTRLDSKQTVELGFALARALEQHERYAEAFSALTQANRLNHAAMRWNAAQFADLARAVRSAFHTPPTPSPNGQGAEVIFIVSLPRAGSSLTEQILASHPQVDGGGELNLLNAVLADESKRRQQAFPLWVPRAAPADWQRLGEEYLVRARRFRGDRPRFTDKMPGNWLRVGAAMAMLPGARVIDNRRDALENCFACYRTLFAEGTQAFTYDVEDLADYWRAYDETSRHWQARYPLRYRLQHYENLVSDPERQIAQLLEFCDLPYAAQCQRFHETPRTIATASAGQVHEPLSRDTARAPAYGALLDPLRSALGYRADVR
jgi:Flp pilus assembly protein TadD